MKNHTLVDTEKLHALILKSADIILTADRTTLGVDEKSGRANFVTEYDKKVQEVLKKGLKEILPEAAFIGEEGEDAPKYSDKGMYWIVDPIDGTTNFIKDYHMSCISVALVVDGEAELAAVYNPYAQELFTARKGEGAFLNGKPIHVSPEPLSNGIVLFGTSPYNAELSRKSFDMAYAYFEKALDIRRSGSAALDLCAIAAGRAEVYFELRLSPWDYAAGALLVTEAGGLVTTVEGGKLSYDKKYSVLAQNNQPD